MNEHVFSYTSIAENVCKCNALFVALPPATVGVGTIVALGAGLAPPPVLLLLPPPNIKLINCPNPPNKPPLLLVLAPNTLVPVLLPSSVLYANPFG